MNKIIWGIVNCENVVDTKTGNIFNEIKDSCLAAVMSGNAKEAIEYAEKHHISKWYTDVKLLINDPEVNAIYIASGSSTHEQYAIAAVAAGKQVYIGTPLPGDYASAKNIALFAKKNNIKLSVAHYWREYPLFKKIKELIDEDVIRKVRSVRIFYSKNIPFPPGLPDPKSAWSTGPGISPELFTEIATQQLDLMVYFFGEVKASSFNSNDHVNYINDNISARIQFKSGVVCNCFWNFSQSIKNERDTCEILGDRGAINFSFFADQKLSVTAYEKTELSSFTLPEYRGQPMTRKVVDYFLGKSPNPCSAEEGSEVIKLIEKFTGKWYNLS